MAAVAGAAVDRLMVPVHRVELTSEILEGELEELALIVLDRVLAAVAAVAEARSELLFL